MPHLHFLALAMGLLVSPDVLILLGNQTGRVGLAFLGMILVAGLIALGTAYSTAVLWAACPEPGGESRGLQMAFGTLPAMVLPLCARLVLWVCASTGILAIAGYVFNEVFVYWFPNLGFSFCLLGFLLMVNLSGPRVAKTAQLFFVATALSGLLVLSALALLGSAQVPLPPATVRSTPVALLQGALGGLVLFVGFDLALFMPTSQAPRSLPVGKYMALGILLGGVTFCIWSLVSIRVVPTDNLATSTVPHMATARMLWGQPGRVVMGIVVLAGVSSAVNALLMGVSRMLVGMARHNLLPAFLAWSPQRAPVALILLALGPAVMMYVGMAGELETEVYARAGLVFWFMYYGAVHLAVLVLARRAHHGSSPCYATWLPLVSMSVIVLGIVGLLWIDSEAGHLVRFMLMVMASVSSLSLCWIGWRLFKVRAGWSRSGAH
jgi:amino acid transporter